MLFAIQLSLVKSKLLPVIFFALISVALYFMYPYAIEQSYAKFKAITQNKQLMSNLVVLQVIECLSGLLFSIFLIRIFYKEKVRQIFKYFIFFPGFVIFPTVFYAESAVFLNVSGLNFQFLAIITAIVIPAFILATKALVRFVVPEYDLRLEIKFILHILQLMISVIISVSLFTQPTTNLMSDFHILQLLAFFGLVFLLAAAGLLKYNRQLGKQISNQK